MNDFDKWINEAREIAEATFANFDLFSLAEGVSVSFNSRLRATLGRAYSRRIQLSGPLWPRATPTERYETVVHEACHVIADYRNRNAGIYNTTPHDWSWKSLMIECGLEPKVTHNIDNSDLTKSHKRPWEVTCGCPSHRNITNTIKNRMDQGRGYTCRTCRQKIVLKDKVAA